jgi:hypothetical protein
MLFTKDILKTTEPIQSLKIGDTIIIDITQEDIDNGKLRSAWHCPIAKSLKRIFGKQPSVTPLCIRIYGPELGDMLVYNINEELSQFMSDFDIERPVSPVKIPLKLSVYPG